MAPTAVNIAALLLLVLPGFLSYRFTVLQRADPTQRGALWQLSEILEHSLYVHLIGAGLSALVHGLLLWWFGQDSYVRFLLQEGPYQLLNKHFLAAILWFTLYPMYVILATTIIGSYNLPEQFTLFVIALVRKPSEWLVGRSRWLAWLPIPSSPLPQQPVWYYAFNTMTNGYRSSIPHVMVYLKNGDVYYGALVTYPIVLDTESEKDFLLRHARYYPQGHWDDEHRLEEYDGIGAVLLNTANVDGIIIYYEYISNPAPA